MLKRCGVVGGGGLEQVSVSPRPLGFGFLALGLRGLGPGLDNCSFWLQHEPKEGQCLDLCLSVCSFIELVVQQLSLSLVIPSRYENLPSQSSI